MGLKGQPPILEGELPFDVKPDDSMWNLADGRLLELSLAKQDGMRWWPHVLRGEPEINIQKVDVHVDSSKPSTAGGSAAFPSWVTYQRATFASGGNVVAALFEMQEGVALQQLTVLFLHITAS